MKNKGIVRHIDELGRLVIPKEIRDEFGIENGDPIEITADKSGVIRLRKHRGTEALESLLNDVEKLAVKKRLPDASRFVVGNALAAIRGSFGIETKKEG